MVTKKTKEPAAPKEPKSLGEAADMLWDAREHRRALAKQVEAAQAEETRLQEWLIDRLPKSDQTGVRGKVARAELESKVVPRCEDWDAFYAWIVQNYNKMKKQEGADPSVAFAYLQRRVGETAIKEAWDNKVGVPGIGKFHAKYIALKKA
jgi:hypothetical protein